MQHRIVIRLLFLWVLASPVTGISGSHPLQGRALLSHHISVYYPEQLTDPQKKIRMTMSQFGYHLSYFTIPLFPITGFINPQDFGIHSYSKPGRKEHNGCLYTCRGGFIDFSHLRAAADWTVYLTFRLLTDPSDFDLPPEAGTLNLKFKNIDDLSKEEIADIAQKIAFERLEWHEAASWHYHPPYHVRTDQQSAFTPEDTYSNFLGTVIGKKIALRILNNLETKSYALIATEEIEKQIDALDPVAEKKDSKLAYDIVDRNRQMQLPADQRNSDVWWDSNVLFRDQRYVFKRDLDLGPEIDPWLVPQDEILGCAVEQDPEIFTVPSKTKTGVSLYAYYDFKITPDTAMFYGRKGQLVHQPIPPFSTKHFDTALRIIASEMEKIFLAGFDRRDCCDPVYDFKNLRRVGLAAILGERHPHP